MSNQNELDQIVDEIFVKSFRTISAFGKTFDASPLNLERVKNQLHRESEAEYRKRTHYPDRVLDSLATVKEAILSYGITRQVYEQYHFVFNIIARDLTNQRWGGVRERKFCR